MTGLYNDTSSSSSSVNLLGPVNSAVNQVSWFDLTSVVLTLNYFIVAFCIFNTLVLLVDFYVRYFKMSKEGDMLHYLKEGEASFSKSWDSWLTYIPLLLVLIAYYLLINATPWNWILGVVFCIAALVKIFHEYSKTPIAKVISGEDTSVIGRAFKFVGSFGGAGGDKKGGGSVISVGGGILGEVVHQVGGLGREAMKQTTGINVQDAPVEKDKKK